MITPEEFPYITALQINDCYAYQDFKITLNDYKPFSHLILTGKNGSGKSTILKSIDFLMDKYLKAENVKRTINNLEKELKYQRDPKNHTFYEKSLNELKMVLLLTQDEFLSQKNFYPTLFNSKNQIIYTFLKADRNSKVKNVENPIKDELFKNKLNENDSSSFFVQQFKQYLVNKKIYQAFAQLEKNEVKVNETEAFFKSLTVAFQQIFEDTKLELEFIKENFEINFNLSDGRKLTFDNLPDGFSAFLSILMDLFTRLDLIRNELNDFSYNPCGIVLIDEPETHLHLILQYQVLPILTTFFPNVQFIVATHSPAVISSIKNTTVFDLTTKTTETDEIVGKSFSELMVSHFGLDNEYSDIADSIFNKINTIVKENKDDKSQLHNKLKATFEENAKYLSPAMRLELESMILENA